MNKALKIGLFLLLLPQLVGAQGKDSTYWHSSTQLNKKRFNAYVYGIGTLAAGSLTGLYFAWYADYPQNGFHFTNDNKNWGGMDKIGHATTTFAVGQASYDVLRWTGVSEKKAIWYGGLTGWGYLAVVEVMDGFSEEWGFSWGDFAFNSAGAALFIGQQLGWKEQRFQLKWSYRPTMYPQYRGDLLGRTWQEQWLKDYNGQTYWLSASPGTFGVDWWPRWLCLSGGYSIDGYVSANGNNSEHPEIISQRQYYFSLDLDLRQIPVKSGFWKTVLHTISFIKIPAPAVAFNQRVGGTRLYWLYF